MLLNKDDFTKQVLNIYKANNNNIIMKDIFNTKGLNQNLVYKYYGSFSNMCSELHLNTSSHVHDYSDEELIDIVKRIYEENHKITAVIIKQSGLISADTLKRRFGSLANAYKLAGLELKTGQRKMVSKNEIVKEIFRLNKIYGYVSKPLFEKYSEYSPKIVSRVFGSFSNMYKELNIARKPSGRVPTNQELIDEAKRLYQKYGFLSYDIIEKYSTISTTCFKDRCKKYKWNGINYYRKIIGCEIPYLNWCESPSAKYTIEQFTQAIGEQPIKEKKFDWLIDLKAKCPTQSPLRLDAYYENAKIAIEYNGPQHYFVDGRYTKNEKQLKHRQYLDKLKIDLVKEHNIKIIVIKYTDVVNEEYIKNAIK